MKVLALVICVPSAFGEEGSGQKPFRHPTRRLDNLDGKFDVLIDSYFTDRNNAGWGSRMRGRFGRITQKLRDDFAKKNEMCNLLENADDEDDEDDDQIAVR